MRTVSYLCLVDPSTESFVEKPREILAAKMQLLKCYHLGRKKNWVSLFCILIFLGAERQIKQSKQQHMVSYRIIENICK